MISDFSHRYAYELKLKTTSFSNSISENESYNNILENLQTGLSFLFHFHTRRSFLLWLTLNLKTFMLVSKLTHYLSSGEKKVIFRSQKSGSTCVQIEYILNICINFLFQPTRRIVTDMLNKLSLLFFF